SLRRSTNLPDSGAFSQGLFFPFPLFPDPARPADKMALYGLSFLLSSIFRKNLRNHRGFHMLQLAQLWIQG
ncbi:MAG: hypothetical protein VB088_01665, partial [Sphaerochaeta sp.]|nr:hypothetical protein [Sphaerochaeta sp.]